MNKNENSPESSKLRKRKSGKTPENLITLTPGKKGIHVKNKLSSAKKPSNIKNQS